MQSQSDCTADTGEQKPRKEGTSYSKVPGASTRKILLNKGIRRTISLKGKEDQLCHTLGAGDNQPSWHGMAEHPGTGS